MCACARFCLTWLLLLLLLLSQILAKLKSFMVEEWRVVCLLVAV